MPANPSSPWLIRFNYERHYKRRGVLVDTRWFLLRWYPPILPTFTLWWKKGIK